jgi:hypothetical protein
MIAVHGDLGPAGPCHLSEVQDLELVAAAVEHFANLDHGGRPADPFE